MRKSNEEAINWLCVSVCVCVCMHMYVKGSAGGGDKGGWRGRGLAIMGFILPSVATNTLKHENRNTTYTCASLSQTAKTLPH